MTPFPAPSDHRARLDGRVALVTGAGAGLGRAYALALSARGADVAIHDIDEKSAAETARLCRALGQRAWSDGYDVANVAEVRRALAALVRTAGGLDIVVNNAGIDEAKTTPEIDERAFDRMISVHVKGTFFVAQAAIAPMRARGGGRIINISSINGMIADRTDPHYNAAKAAILGITRALARELAPWNILVNAVAPGHVVTDATRARGEARMREVSRERIPLRRYAMPEEIAHTVCFLAGPESAFVTGQVLSPNGGEAIVGF